MTPRVTPRFRGQTASAASLHALAVLIVGTIAAVGVGGLVGSAVALTFFAVGAGAGYSLSGSV